MVLLCGPLIIVCSDMFLMENDFIDLGYKLTDVEIYSEDRKYIMSIRINKGLIFKLRLQALVVNIVARLTFEPSKTKDVYPFNYVSLEQRQQDWNNGYWERLISKSSESIHLDESMIIGYGLIH